MNKYKYSRLSESQLRLLVLQPGQHSEPIHVRLFEQTFDPPDDVPEYEALSYVWGGEDNPDSVFVASVQDCRLSPSTEQPSGLRTSDLADPPSGRLSIRQNLASALRQLRQPEEPRILWCDSICINQDDIEEKGEQVQCMDDVFRHARRVVAWLGPEADDSTLAVETMTEAAAQITVDFSRYTIQPAPDADARYSDWPRLPFSIRQWRAIWRLISRPWFRRLWIWQEIILANASAIMVCGASEISWDAFKRSICCMISSISAGIDEMDESENTGFMKHTEMVFALISLPSRSFSLNILDHTLRCECALDHDRDYALLGLFFTDLHIQPNYLLGPEDAFKDFALRLEKRYRTLNFLGLCESAKRPSWVPDLARLAQNPAGFQSGWASGPSDPQMKTLDAGTVQVHGVQCGAVRDNTRPVVPLDVSDSALRKIAVDISKSILGRDPSIWDETRLRMLTDALMGGLCAEFVASEPGMSGFPSLASAAALLRSLASGTNDDLQAAASDDDASRLVVNLREMLRGRSVITADDGSFVLGPGSARPGDLIWVVLGSHSPLVLRRADEPGTKYKYTVVGACYYKPYMNVEALLGDLPAGWRFTFERAQYAPLYVHEDGTKTMEDPRLRDVALPPGWKATTDEETGGPTWTREDGRWTHCDPRLNAGELEKRGVALEDVLLV